MRLGGDVRENRPGRGIFTAACVAALVGCGPQGTKTVATPADLQPSAQRAELCSAANVVGVGLKAEYFAEPGWRGEPLLTRTDAAVDFVGSADLPEPLRATPPRSIRWSGWIKAPTNGVYRFHVQPAQARVRVARADIHAEAPDAPGLDMVAGRFYPITVEIDGVEASQLPVRLEWTAPHGARYVIPRALLNLPTETVSTPRSG